MSAFGDLSIDTYLDRVSSASPTPGGGSVASLVGALAAALGSMASAIAAKKSIGPEARESVRQCLSIRMEFLRLGEADETAFQAVMEALRRSKDDPSRADRLETSLRTAADVPLAVGRTCLDLLALLDPLSRLSSRHAVSDVGAAAHFALAALRGSLLNVQINAALLADRDIAEQLEVAARRLETEGQDRCRKVVEHVIACIRG